MNFIPIKKQRILFSLINLSNSFEKKDIKNYGYKNQNGIRYGPQEEESPDKEENYQPKAKHNKMARNIFALDNKR